MREKLVAHVEALFREAADTPRNQDLKDEILQNALDRYDDLIRAGETPEQAYQQAADSIGDVRHLWEKPKYQPVYQPQPEKKRHTGWIIAAVIAGLLLILLVGAMFLGFHLLDMGRSGFGRYEDPEDLIEDRVETVEDRVEQWAEGVEEQVEQAVEGAIAGGVASFSYNYSQEDSYQIGSAEVETRNINRLVIDWISGQVTVEAYEGDTISIVEPEQDKEKNQLRWRQEGETLTIRYCASTGNATAPSKTLTVKVPMELAFHLQYVQVSTVSADASLSGLTADELQFDSTSGSLQANGEFDRVDADTTSGGMNFVGAARNVEIDTISGEFEMICSETPRELSFDSTSGDLTLALPERGSFEAEFDSVSGDFSSELGNIRGDELHYEGTEKGSYGEMEFDTVSGDVKILKTAADVKPA